MKIRISEIQNIAMAICNKYIQNHGEYLETEKDNFWFIDMEQAIARQAGAGGTVNGGLVAPFILPLTETAGSAIPCGVICS